MFQIWFHVHTYLGGFERLSCKWLRPSEPFRDFFWETFGRLFLGDIWPPFFGRHLGYIFSSYLVRLKSTLSWQITKTAAFSFCHFQEQQPRCRIIQDCCRKTKTPSTSTMGTPLRPSAGLGDSSSCSARTRLAVLAWGSRRTDLMWPPSPTRTITRAKTKPFCSWDETFSLSSYCFSCNKVETYTIELIFYWVLQIIQITALGFKKEPWISLTYKTIWLVTQQVQLLLFVFFLIPSSSCPLTIWKRFIFFSKCRFFLRCTSGLFLAVFRERSTCGLETCTKLQLGESTGSTRSAKFPGAMRRWRSARTISRLWRSKGSTATAPLMGVPTTKTNILYSSFPMFSIWRQNKFNSEFHFIIFIF